MQNPIAFHAEMMGDIMYYNQALQQPDAKQFTNAVIKEVNGHFDNKHWKLVKKKDVPNNAQVVPSVWSMQRKCDLTTIEVSKQKARLNLHGGKQVYGMNYFETYAPVVTWFAISLMIVLASFSPGPFSKLILLWHTLLHGTAPRYLDCYQKLQGPSTQATQEGCGIHTLWTSSLHWATLRC
jgi:hypothetical protein